MSFLVDTGNCNNYLLANYNDAIIISKSALGELHHIHKTSGNTVDYIIDTFPTNFNVGVAYILPPGKYGAPQNMCCNGIRFGDNGDYISFPHLPDEIFNI